MLSEIEKLYENAGVKGFCENFFKDIMPETCLKECEDEDYKCKDCDCWKLPPFTAEKQIEIIKLLTQQCDLAISHFGEWEFIHFDGQEPTQITGKDFTETFVKLINAYWENLTNKEKAEIKRILE